MKKKFKWNPEKLLGISAMTISFITLLIFIHQTNLMSKQNYLSILPYLSLSISNSPGDNSFRLSLDNYGVGPAIIESISIKYQGDEYDLADFNHEVLTFLKAKVPELDSLKVISYSTLERGLAIPANVSYNILEVKNSKEDYLLLHNNLNKLLADGLYFEIIYKSIQNEYWMITNDTQGPKKLD